MNDTNLTNNLKRQDSTNLFDNTKIPQNPKKYFEIYYLIFLLIYGALIIIYPTYAFNFDDQFFWLHMSYADTLLNGIRPGEGRFFPLGSMDLNLLMQFSRKPLLYLSYNACLLLTIGILLWYLLSYITQNKLFRFCVCVIILLNPSFVLVILGICYSEKVASLALLVFVISSLKVLRNEKYADYFVIIGLLSGNIAIYLKEPMFIMLGIIAICNLITAIKYKAKLAILYFGFLLLSAMIFLGLYVYLVLPNINDLYSSAVLPTQMERIWRLGNSLLDTLLIHSWILLLFPCVIILRIMHYIRTKKLESSEVFLDSLMLGSLVYFLAFVKLELMRGYYFVPIYFVCGVSVAYFIAYYWKLYRHIRYIIFICGGIFLLHSLPQAIWNYVFIKSQGVAQEQSIDFLSQYIKKQKNKVNIYFYGLGKEITSEEFFIEGVGYYLQYFYDIRNFDIRTDKAVYSPEWNYYPYSILTIHNSNTISIPQKDDLIFLNANTTEAFDKDILDKKYELIFQSHVIGIPCITLKSVVVYLMQGKDSNPFRLPINNFIYKVK